MDYSAHTLWVRCDDWIVLNLDAFCARLGDLDEANFDGKLNHMSQFFRLRRRLPRVPLTSRGGPLGARASSGERAGGRGSASPNN